jgi:murein DD-endopeptidase MepM/ murein hydrolase activator NlpD
MTPQVVALQLARSRTVRRLLGCGCAATGALVAMPVLLIASMTTGVLGNLTGSGVGQSDPFALGSASLVTGSGEPLPPGSFRVAQGFGCTTVSVEPPPPGPYTCPPDAAHGTAVRFHTGIDLAAATGTGVFAVTAGTVRVVVSTGGFGIHALLVTTVVGAAPVTYLYGHLSEVVVPDGAAVSAGVEIGRVGSTGNSTGPHLHFEVDVGGVPVNPCSVFPAGYLVPAGVAAAGCVATLL